MNKIVISIADVYKRCQSISTSLQRGNSFYGVPRGGITPAMTLAAMTGGKVVGNPYEATIIVDDLIDSGATKLSYKSSHPEKPFIALFEKTDHNDWIIFPWEVDESGQDKSTEDIFIRLLEYVGEDPSREGLVETPKRMAKAWEFWTSGYSQDPNEVFKTFEDGGEGYDQMLIVGGIPFFSHCEHHLAAIFGEVHIAYIPNGRIAGLSKFARLVDVFARRLQVQERLTTQIADTIQKNLNPLGVAVVIKARHFCMESRGVQKPGTETITSSMLGAFRDKPEARAEFFSLIK